MSALNEPQRQRALEAMRECLSAPAGDDGRTPMKRSTDADQQRVSLIEGELAPLLSAYLSGGTVLAEFKSKVDGLNKRNELWGFKGIKGQMFFNMVVNVADDADECDQEVKAALAVPANEQLASSRIKTFASFVNRLGEQWVEAGNTRHGAPKVGSVPFFLSYFWQIAERDVWPVYYTASVQTMTDLNLWQPSGDSAEDYIDFKHIHEELVTLFTEASGQPFDLYKVEHVFWYRGDDPYQAGKGGEKPEPPVVVTPEDGPQITEATEGHLPESHVPPIVAILPRLARNDKTLTEAAKRSGITMDRAFEKYIDAAFTMLAYETKLLGQGKGRVPDGLAVAMDDSYAVLWDAKVRGSGYSMGTDDRAIREYITTQSRELKRRRSLRNIYYLVISSSFADDYDDTIRSIKMDTDVNEVTLMEADALVALVDAKLRAPLHVTLGPDGIQRLFSVSGVLSAEAVRESLI